MRRLTLFLAIALLLSCGEPSSPEQAAPKTSPGMPGQPEYVSGDVDVDNLLNIAYGASVISRTGEFDLEHSALHAIDSMSTTRWSSPPQGAAQTMVFAFAGPARVTQVGVSVSPAGGGVMFGRVRIDASMDGTDWREVAVIEPKNDGAPQLVGVEPFQAAFIRAEVVEPRRTDAHIRSLHAIGSETARPAPKDFTGCWTLAGGAPLSLTTDGARLSGSIGGERPTFLEGGSDGRVARMMWMRGPMWGYAALTTSADGASVSALTFHEEVLLGSVGVAWLGSRCERATAAPSAPAPPLRAFLDRTGRWSMFGLAFDREEKLVQPASDPTLDAAATLIREIGPHHLRVASFEFREQTPEANRARSERRLAALRAALAARGVDVSGLEFTARGPEWPAMESTFAVMRLLNSRVDLEKK